MSLILEPEAGYDKLEAAKAEVIRVLLYFDIFQHPVMETELLPLFQSGGFREEDVAAALSALSSEGFVSVKNGYCLVNHGREIIGRRIRGENAAQQSMRTAQRFSRLISGFPFVRGISLSGSLSKNYMDEKSDIDYFIITKAGRMWLSRTLLVLFKKIFLLNSHRHFCVNYFISEDNLEVPDQNIFTATEIAFIIPTWNYTMYLKFMQANAWRKQFLPNFPLRNNRWVIRERSNVFKRLVELILGGSIGEKLDEICFRLTLKHWKKKFSQFDERTFDFRLRSRKNESKHHPLGFQEKVLRMYGERIQKFEQKHRVQLHAEDPVYA